MKRKFHSGRRDGARERRERRADVFGDCERGVRERKKRLPDARGSKRVLLGDGRRVVAFVGKAADAPRVAGRIRSGCRSALAGVGARGRRVANRAGSARVPRPQAHAVASRDGEGRARARAPRQSARARVRGVAERRGGRGRRRRVRELGIRGCAQGSPRGVLVDQDLAFAVHGRQNRPRGMPRRRRGEPVLRGRRGRDRAAERQRRGEAHRHRGEIRGRVGGFRARTGGHGSAGSRQGDGRGRLEGRVAVRRAGGDKRAARLAEHLGETLTRARSLLANRRARAVFLRRKRSSRRRRMTRTLLETSDEKAFHRVFRAMTRFAYTTLPAPRGAKRRHRCT